MRFWSRIVALTAALTAFAFALALSVAFAAPGNGGSQSTATAGPGQSSQGCDGSHHSDTGHGANQSGPYDNTCDGSPSANGNGNGNALGKPCAGCVGNADDKNPKGQSPNGSDHNAGYECDRNHGIGRTNPAHTGCTRSMQTSLSGGGCEGGACGVCKGDNCGGCKDDDCDRGGGGARARGAGGRASARVGGGGANARVGGGGASAPGGGVETPVTPQQQVLGATVQGTTTPRTAPGPRSRVLGEERPDRRENAGARKSVAAPQAAITARAARGNGSLPFTGTDGVAVLLLAGVLALIAGVATRRFLSHRA